MSIVLFPGISFAGDGWFSWDEGNTVLQVPKTILTAMDLGTTLDITRHADKYNEVNPILGKHPSQDKVWKYFITAYIITTGITYVLPSRWSHGFQMGMIGVEAYWVNHNLRIGLRVKF